MLSDSLREGLIELYQNECFGDVFVDAVWPAFPGTIPQHMLGTIAQFETETKARLRASLIELGLPTEQGAEIYKEANAMAQTLSVLSWREVLEHSRAGIEARVIPRFRAIAALAAQEGNPVAMAASAFMVLHEEAILEVIERTLADDGESTGPVEAMLHFPLLHSPGQNTASALSGASNA